MKDNPINYLLIGAQKSGTSWLAEMLAEHPDVFRSEKKEIHFFNLRENYGRGIDWYLRHFAEAGGKAAIGECTPNYLWVGDAPEPVQEDRLRRGKPPLTFAQYDYVIRNIHELVHEHLPDVKLLVILRNPVDRAISSFFHAIRSRRVAPSANILHVGGQEGIIGMGFYYRHLVEWSKLFPRERFLFLIYEEDIRENKSVTLRKVFRHLEVDDAFEPNHLERRLNERASGPFMRAAYHAPRSARVLFRLLPQLHRLSALDITVSDADREELAAIYEPENQYLEEFVGRSLACWRK